MAKWRVSEEQIANLEQLADELMRLGWRASSGADVNLVQLTRLRNDFVREGASLMGCIAADLRDARKLCEEQEERSLCPTAAWA